MTAEIVTIADAVVEALNGREWSLAFEAERLYAPVAKLSELAESGGLVVTVVPRSLEGALMDRQGLNQIDYVVNLVVQQKLPAGNRAAPDQLREWCDERLALVEEFADWFRRNRLSAPTNLPLPTLVANAPIFAADHLDQEGLFTSVLTLTYRKNR